MRNPNFEQNSLSVIVLDAGSEAALRATLFSLEIQDFENFELCVLSHRPAEMGGSLCTRSYHWLPQTTGLDSYSIRNSLRGTLETVCAGRWKTAQTVSQKTAAGLLRAAVFVTFG